MSTRKISLIALCVAISACGGSPDSRPATTTAPTPVPAAAGPAVTGMIWLHARDGVRPFANARLGGWVYSGSSAGWVWGAVDASGRYALPAADASRVRIQVAEQGTYQPCAVTVAPGDRPGPDVHVVSDPAQLGAQLPAPLREQGQTLSGVVYELGADGRRTPLVDVRVTCETDDGFLAATTLTDPAGRYVICGLSGENGAYVYASKSGYVLYEKFAPLAGNTVLDIQMRR